ncbi:MAG: sigma-54-dependent Fis family transcriptional regulator [Verrucomicrobiales bacterium]|nr:sigma-54-dependent Fis family transcriptional regulator [Verrucomicrobiales bacterium]
MTEAPLTGTTVLVLEDDALLRRQLVAFIEQAGADVVAAGDLGAARRALESMSFDLALTDVNLPDGLGTDLLRESVFPPGTGVVVMTGEGDVKRAVDAMRWGAADYLTKPFEVGELTLVFARVRRERQARRVEEHRREDQSPREDEFVFGSALAALRAQLDRILTADTRMVTQLAPVLIHGETGTGKTTIARWLHVHGPRSEKPMVEVNCSALPETLAESELFGHERGAFTDARTARMGLFEAAHGGTLFLDELASLSMPLQAKVLTAIEDGRIRRVGGNRPIAVDVRVIAASNRDLREAVRAGEFREDLLHRLDLFRLGIPPLRERRSDIVPLARALMLRACRRHRLAPREVSEDGCRRLEAYAWPGNVRELAHELERALVFEDGPLTFAHLHLSIPEADAERGRTAGAGGDSVGGAGEVTAGDWFNATYRFPESGFSLDAAVDRLVLRAVDQARGNVSAAARLLGVTRDVVRYRLEGRVGIRAGGRSPTPLG